MRVRALSPSGDFLFGNGVQNYLVNSPQAVAQCVYTALRLLLGEWFLDTTAGVPWLTKVIGFGTESTQDTVVRNAILGVQGVTEILSYNSERVGTVFTITDLVVATLYGPATVPLVGLQIPLGPGYGVSSSGNNGYGV
jgi:hypothetical protein